MQALEEALRYTFSDVALLSRALTHPSIGLNNNQRLEFLGDAALELIVSRALYDAHPHSPEGRLTRLRAGIVREEQLCIYARRLNLGALLNMSPGEERTGGREKPSILADAFEAVIAAVYLDGGFDAAQECVKRIVDGEINKSAPDKTADHKTRLQELIQARGLSAPIYRDIDESGPDHAKAFSAEVIIDDRAVAVGSGRTKKAAEQAAAELALDKLKKGKHTN